MSVYFYADNCGGSILRTRQANMVVIHVDSHGPLPWRFAENPTRNIQLN